MSSDTEDIILNPDDYIIPVRPIIIQQNAIGWRHLFNGRFGKAWSVYQDQYYKSQPSQSSKHMATGEKWQVSIILYIWDKWFTLWQQRNQEVHGHDARTKAVALQ